VNTQTQGAAQGIGATLAYFRRIAYLHCFILKGVSFECAFEIVRSSDVLCIGRTIPVEIMT